MSDSLRYFELKFSGNELTMFEHKGRGRVQKLDLPTLPKLVLLKKYQNNK